MSSLLHPIGTPTTQARAATLAWLLLILAMSFPTVLAWTEFVALVDHRHGANPLQQAVIVVGKLLQFSLPVVACVLLDRRWPQLARPSWRGLGVGVGFGLLVALGMFALYYGWLRGLPQLTHTPALVRTKLREFGLDSLSAFILFGLFLSIVHSLLEEYYWRWFVFGRLAKLLPLFPAIVVASLAFMAHHVVVLGEYFAGRFWTVAVPLSLCVACGGAFWAWLYHRSGSIGSVWLSHLICDAAIMVVGYDLAFVRQ